MGIFVRNFTRNILRKFYVISTKVVGGDFFLVHLVQEDHLQSLALQAVLINSKINNKSHNINNKQELHVHTQPRSENLYVHIIYFVT